MWPVVFFFVFPLWANEIDLTTIQQIDEQLPAFNEIDLTKEYNHSIIRKENKYSSPNKVVPWVKIQESANSLGSIKGGSPIVRLEDNKTFITEKTIWVKYYTLEDENGFKYLINKNGETTLRIDSRYVRPIQQEISLHVPPTKYTPATEKKLEAEYDKNLNFRPEVSFYSGYVMGDFMKDLFNDSNARTGFSNQFGAHLFADWKLPLKVGGVLHFERATYGLKEDGKINYQSLSFGPQFKTKDFELAGLAYRFQLQIRVSPFAKVNAETSSGAVNFNFNSTDLLTTFEHPMKNTLGEFVLGVFTQSQWLNFREQPEIVSVRASNKTNTSLGLFLSQVFE